MPKQNYNKIQKYNKFLEIPGGAQSEVTRIDKEKIKKMF